MAARLALAVVAVVAVLAACGLDGGGDEDPAARPGADCEPARPAPATGAAQTLRHGGHDRSYLLAVPPGYDGRQAFPVVLDFHGHGGSKEQQEANTSLGEAGTARGFIVVTPDALGSPRRWNWSAAEGQADDFGFVHALLADLRQRLCVDADRVYAAGHSNGSAFAAFLACHPPYELAAVAMVSATTPTTCPDGVTPAAIAIHGTDDPTVPYGGGGRRNLPAAPDVMAGYAERYGCATPPREDQPAPGVQRRRYVDCPGASEVVLDTVVGGVHAWPGGQQAARQPGSSAAGRAFAATDEILDFFARHERGPW